MQFLDKVFLNSNSGTTTTPPPPPALAQDAFLCLHFLTQENGGFSGYTAGLTETGLNSWTELRAEPGPWPALA